MAYAYPSANVGDRFLITNVGTLCGQRIMNTWWYTLSVMIGSPNIGSVMDQLETAFIAGAGVDAKFAGCCPDNYALDETWIQPVDPIRYVKKVYARGINGSWGENSNTANVAGVVTRRSVKATRKGVSSLHVPIAAEPSAMANGLVSNALKTKLSSLALQMEADITTLAGHVFTPIVRSGPLPLEAEPIGSCFAQAQVRIMRRRTVGLGI